MNKLLVITALAVGVSTLSTSSSFAAPANPSPLNSAVEDTSLVESVHCRVGWRHHNPNRWRRADGCRRYYRGGGVVVVPGRTRYVIRDGVRVRVRDGGARTTIRSGGDRTTIRSRTDINVREGRQRDGARQDRGRRGDGGGQGKQAPATQN